MIPEDHVSEHFTRKELACPHCGKYLIDSNLLIGLEQLRALGPEPIKVHDGCRCTEHNKAVGGAQHSEHLCEPSNFHPITCFGADIEIMGLTMQQMFDRAIQVPVFLNGGIGVYDGKPFIHVDTRLVRARWGRVLGKYVSAACLVNVDA